MASPMTVKTKTKMNTSAGGSVHGLKLDSVMRSSPPTSASSGLRFKPPHLEFEANLQGTWVHENCIDLPLSYLTPILHADSPALMLALMPTIVSLKITMCCAGAAPLFLPSLASNFRSAFAKDLP
ncbi:hypothetical protein VNO77_27734 [Canavalia gladiata]|uniref:Uncharacterized protein n=1 Tax=Canavalia gladiata TaxID=3824 RepID=A0AAN9KXU5_CANGL